MRQYEKWTVKMSMADKFVATLLQNAHPAKEEDLEEVDVEILTIEDLVLDHDEDTLPEEEVIEVIEEEVEDEEEVETLGVMEEEDETVMAEEVTVLQEEEVDMETEIVIRDMSLTRCTILDFPHINEVY